MKSYLRGIAAALAVVLVIAAGAYGNPLMLATGGLVARLAGDWFSDRINAVGQGVTTSGDTTATLVAACTYALAQGKPLYLPPGTYTIDGADMPGCSLQGDGSGLVTIQRKASAVGGWGLRWSGRGNFSIKGITFDGNKAAQTVTAPTIYLVNDWGFTLDDVQANNAKVSHGAQVDFPADAAHSTRSVVRNSSFSGNGGDGLHQHGASQDFTVRGNIFANNGGGGLTIENNGIYPVPVASILRPDVEDNVASGNGGSGISVGSFCGSASLTFCVFGYDTMAADQAKIVNNRTYSNLAYGIVAQVNRGYVGSNWAMNNGTGVSGFWAGILANAAYTTFEGNHADNNDYYGMDAGGCAYCVIKGNVFRFNGNATINGGIGLNLEASPHTEAFGNQLYLNGTSAGGIQLSIRPYGGSGTTNGSGGQIGFNFVGGNNLVHDNVMTGLNNNQYCVYAVDDNPNLDLHDNVCSGVAGGTAYWLESTSLVKHHNVIDSAFPVYTVGLTSSSLVIPDYVEDAQIISNTSSTLNLIVPSYMANYISNVYKVTVTAQGSNYGNPQLALPCGATVQMTVTQDGKVAFGRVTNKGSGCTPGTSAPIAVTDSAGTGSGATATYSVDPINTLNGRHLRLDFTAATPTALTPSTNIQTSNNVALQLVQYDTVELSGWPNGPTSALWNTERVTHLNISSTSSGVPTNTSCGTGSPTAAAGANSKRGTVNVGGGSVTSCQFAWATPTAWATAPFCSLRNISVSGDTGSVAATTSGFTATFASSVGGGSFDYSCEP